jgi:hypothetical protein
MSVYIQLITLTYNISHNDPKQIKNTWANFSFKSLKLNNNNNNNNNNAFQFITYNVQD